MSPGQGVFERDLEQAWEPRMAKQHTRKPRKTRTKREPGASAPKRGKDAGRTIAAKPKEAGELTPERVRHAVIRLAGLAWCWENRYDEEDAKDKRLLLEVVNLLEGHDAKQAHSSAKSILAALADPLANILRATGDEDMRRRVLTLLLKAAGFDEDKIPSVRLAHRTTRYDRDEIDAWAAARCKGPEVRR
jgi:hypothetical protein